MSQQEGTDDAGSGGRIHLSHYHQANEIPKGLILPLFPRKEGIPTILHRHPLICLRCGSLANPFCGREERSCWTCALCQTENAIDSISTSTSASGSTDAPEFVHPEVEYRTALPTPPLLSHHRTHSGTCLQDQAHAASSSLASSHSSSSLSTTYPGAASATAPGIVLVIDRNMSTRTEAAALMHTLEQTLLDPHLDPGTPISLLTFGGTVSLYRVGRFGGDANTPFVLKHDVIDRALTGVDQQRLSGAFARNEYSVPLFAGRNHLILSLRNMLQDGTFRFADEGGDHAARQVDEEDEGEEARFLGTAIDILNHCYHQGKRARVLVFITGSPYGPGDDDKATGATTLPTDVAKPHERRRYFTRLSQRARMRGLALDVFCLGLAAHLDAPCLHALVSRTGGAVLLYPSAQDPEVFMDIYKILFYQLLPDPAHLATVEMRVSSHMEIAEVLLAGGSDQEGGGGGGDEMEGLTEGLRVAAIGSLSRNSSSGNISGMQDGAAGAGRGAGRGGGGAGGTGGGAITGMAQGVGNKVSGWASSLTSWLTSQGSIVPEGQDDFVATAGSDGGSLVVNLCGPSASLKEGWDRKHAQEQAQGKALTPRRYPYWQGLKRITLPRLSPYTGGSTSDLCVLYRPRDTVFGIWGSRPDEFFIQSVLRYVEGNTLITRVVTEQVNNKMTTRTHEPMAVLAAKRAVASILRQVPAGSTSQAAAGARQGLEKVVEEIATLYPCQHAYVRKRGGFGKPCGTEFARAMELLYQTQRGCLLGYHMQGEDLAYTLRHRFLSLGVEDAMRMMAPTLLSTGPIGGETVDVNTTLPVLSPWPCQTMALWSNMILVLDTQDRIVIWVGREVAYMLAAAPHTQAAPAGGGGEGEGEGQQQEVMMMMSPDNPYAPYAPFHAEAHRSLEASRAYAQQARQDRFPTPHVLEIAEGDPLERFLWARVIPTHKDAPDVLLASFPQLRDLPPQGVEALRVVFAELPTDEESLQQYVRRLTPAAVAAQFGQMGHNTAAGVAMATSYAQHHHRSGAASTSAQ